MQASNTGHGHVRPRPDGVKARCGGPGLCGECAREQAHLHYASSPTVEGRDKVVALLWDTDPQALAAIPPDEVPIAPAYPRAHDVFRRVQPHTPSEVADEVPIQVNNISVKGNCGVVHDSFEAWQTCGACRLPPAPLPLTWNELVCCARDDKANYQCYNCPTPLPKAPDVWMQALSSNGRGVAVDLVNPTADSISFRTIATVLARIPRFGGHTRNGPYSVAQHCIEGAHAIIRDGHPLLAAAAFLIHDAHEAYIGDVTTPVQKALAKLATDGDSDLMLPGRDAGYVVKRAIAELKRRLDAAIYPAAGLPWPLPPHIAAVVKEYDLRMMVTERDARLDPPPYPWTRTAPAVEGCCLNHWSEGTVAALYLAAAQEMLPTLANAPRAKVPLSRNICGNDD